MTDSEKRGRVAHPSQTDGAPKDPRVRPDPATGEVRAGPGDAGLQDRPEINAGSSGIQQLSNRRLAIGLAIGATLTVLVFIIRAMF